MTELPEDLQPLVGERVHGLDPAGIVVLLTVGDDALFAFPRTMTLARGQELVLTEEILLASLDRKGESIWMLDEDRQRLRFNGTLRWNFGAYPRSEHEYDVQTTPDNSRYIQRSQTIATYGPDRAGSVNGLHVSLSQGW